MVSVLASGTHAGSNPAEAVGFFGRKKSSARLRRGSKTMSQICGMEITCKSGFLAKFVGHFSPIFVPRYQRALMSLDVERLWGQRAELKAELRLRCDV